MKDYQKVSEAAKKDQMKILISFYKIVLEKNNLEKFGEFIKTQRDLAALWYIVWLSDGYGEDTQEIIGNIIDEIQKVVYGKKVFPEDLFRSNSDTHGAIVEYLTKNNLYRPNGF